MANIQAHPENQRYQHAEKRSGGRAGVRITVREVAIIKDNLKAVYPPFYFSRLFSCEDFTLRIYLFQMDKVSRKSEAGQWPR